MIYGLVSAKKLDQGVFRSLLLVAAFALGWGASTAHYHVNEIKSNSDDWARATQHNGAFENMNRALSACQKDLVALRGSF